MSNSELVKRIVQQRITAGQSFTAYDITVEARNQGARIRHGESRDIVHQLFQDGSMGAAYQRSVVDIGVKVNPFVYHRFDSDPMNYQSAASGASAAASTSAAAPAARPGLVRRVLNTIWGQSNNQAAGASSGRRQATRKQAARRDPIKLDLDASDFLPISRDELMDATKGMNLWASPWFGRRDLIPPTTDARTKLIDRAMVANGLLSPEQLLEIHRVGAEMDHYRPDPLLLRHQSQLAGKAAVEEDKKRKAEEKRKKKEEAAARREQRRADIEYRKANDIIFLGDGISAYLVDRESDTEKLVAADLPVLASAQNIAETLGISVSKLRWLSFHNEIATRTHYVHFQIPKKSGGVRNLSKPHQMLDMAQRWIFENVLKKLPTENAAHGFVAQRSIATNASQHVGRDVLLNMDLEAFFPNITFYRVRAFFKTLGYSGAVATIFAALCTECPRRTVTYAGQAYHVATGPRGLPQGACTSPAISNQIAQRLDRRLQGLANKLELSYTRYADDMTFSGNSSFNQTVGYVMACVRHVAQDEGFAINPKKTRVLRRNQAQNVTGLIVNDKPSVPRKKIRLIRAILHNAAKHGLESQNRDNHSNFRSWLEGNIAYIAMTRPELGQKMLQQFHTLS